MVDGGGGGRIPVNETSDMALCDSLIMQRVEILDEVARPAMREEVEQRSECRTIGVGIPNTSARTAQLRDVWRVMLKGWIWRAP